MIIAHGSDQSTIIVEEQPGKATLTEQGGVFSVTDGQGNVQFTGSEVGAELAFWRTTFGVPVQEGFQKPSTLRIKADSLALNLVPQEVRDLVNQIWNESQARITPEKTDADVQQSDDGVVPHDSFQDLSPAWLGGENNSEQ